MNFRTCENIYTVFTEILQTASTPISLVVSSTNLIIPLWVSPWLIFNYSLSVFLICHILSILSSIIQKVYLNTLASYGLLPREAFISFYVF